MIGKIYPYIIILFALLPISSLAQNQDNRFSDWKYLCSTSETPPVYGWIETMNHEVRERCRESQNTIWMRAKLIPKGSSLSETLFIEQSFMALQVWLSEKKIYSYEGNLLPSRHHFIDIERLTKETFVYFRVSSWANALGLRGELNIGKGYELFSEFFMKHIGQFILSVLTLIIGIFSFSLWLFWKKSGIYFWFAGFTISLALFLLKFSELIFLANVQPQIWMWLNLIGVCFSGPFLSSFHKDLNIEK